MSLDVIRSLTRMQPIKVGGEGNGSASVGLNLMSRMVLGLKYLQDNGPRPYGHKSHWASLDTHVHYVY